MILNEQQKYILKRLDKSIKLAEALSILGDSNLSEEEKYNKLWDLILKEILEQMANNNYC